MLFFYVFILCISFLLLSFFPFYIYFHYIYFRLYIKKLKKHSSDKNQNDRILALQEFKSGRIPLLIATDVAARGLDIPQVHFLLLIVYCMSSVICIVFVCNMYLSIIIMYSCMYVCIYVSIIYVSMYYI